MNSLDIKRYNSANDFFFSLFHEKVYKISLDGGMSCPNRNADGSGGCIFCSRGGSGDFASKRISSIKEQIDRAIDLVSDKKGKKFIAYYQSYTNTYAEIDYLEKLFTETINDDRIVGLSIATRPDSISDECLELLIKLNKIKKVFIELGLQTSNDETAKLINRGYDSIVYERMAKRLRDNGINVITHLIIGLPGESLDDILKSIDFINELTDGVKLQLLHVLKDTELERIYNDGLYKPLSIDEYLGMLSKCVNRLNPNIIIHRLTGDGPKNILIGPLWTANKKVVLNSINRYFKENDIIQGSEYRYESE